MYRGFCETCCDHVKADETFNSFCDECGDGLIGVEEVDVGDDFDDDDDDSPDWF
jgi:hypothetical protein